MEKKNHRACQAVLSRLELYLYNFIGIIQGGAEEWRQMKKHLFCSIDLLFRPNNPLDMAREKPISLKKLVKCGAQWSTKKTVLGWAIDISQKVFTLPSTCKEMLEDALSAISNQATIVPKKNDTDSLKRFAAPYR